VLICKPGDPEAKGLVERFHDYLERAFLPGRVFGSPADFNSQLRAAKCLALPGEFRSACPPPTDRTFTVPHQHPRSGTQRRKVLPPTGIQIFGGTGGDQHR
jgi:hypothetical protein